MHGLKTHIYEEEKQRERERDKDIIFACDVLIFNQILHKYLFGFVWCLVCGCVNMCVCIYIYINESIDVGNYYLKNKKIKRKQQKENIKHTFSEVSS